MAEHTRYISDGETLYAVMNMKSILKQPAEVIREIYLYTTYDYKFECSIRDMIKVGLIEQVDPTEPYTYPFDAVEATLEEIRDSGILTTQEIIKMDTEVRTQMGLTEK